MMILYIIEVETAVAGFVNDAPIQSGAAFLRVDLLEYAINDLGS